MLADSLSRTGVVVIQPSAPAPSYDGDLWFDPVSGTLSVSDGGQWISVSSGGGGGPALNIVMGDLSQAPPAGLLPYTGTFVVHDQIGGVIDPGWGVSFDPELVRFDTVMGTGAVWASLFNQHAVDGGAFP